MRPHHKYQSKWVITYKNQKEFRINKKIKTDNLYFPLNNILTRIFKELKKYIKMTINNMHGVTS